ncbi:MAG: ParB/Srx family N-terminal domain-containing protein [Planctomycetes bacterium]|nr:ParB/Srx family N-terminal domain-containing protein [Planctomycetota bacterium]
MDLSSPTVRCVYSRLVPTGELTPHPQNPNRHSETQVSMLADLIRSVGWRFPIVVSKRSGFIIAGHARLLAAQRLGLETVPVDFQEFATESEEMIQLLADNKIPELAHRDPETERALMERLLAENTSTAMMGYLPKEVYALMREAAVLGELAHQVIPAMELQPHEHYDYIVLVFRSDYDWMNALQALGIRDVNFSVLKDKKKIGIGRVIDGTRVLSRLLPAQGDSQPRPVGNDQHAPDHPAADAGVHGPGTAVV